MAAFQVPWVPERVLAARFDSARGPLRAARAGRGKVCRPARPAPDALTGPINWYRAARHSGVPAHRVAVPTTYVWGSRDPFLGRAAAELTREHVTGPTTRSSSSTRATGCPRPATRRWPRRSCERVARAGGAAAPG